MVGKMIESEEIIEAIAGIAKRYQIAAITPLLASCRAFAHQEDLSIAVLGRFKAGKSSFLNDRLGRDLLPVGVIPVTAIVTEISYGPREKATVEFLDGRKEVVDINAIHQFIAERENPENVKRVAGLKVELPSLERFRGLRFVDTPGLESTLAHNTEAALQWLPNVALALVAVSIETPLAKHDLALLKELRQHTPNISLLLTKADLLGETERNEVINFIRDQMVRSLGIALPIFPYSIRLGYESLKKQVEQTLIQGTLDAFEQQRGAVLQRKLETLIQELDDFLSLALRSAQTLEAERASLTQQVIGNREAVEDLKSELRLVIRQATGGSRARIAKQFDRHRGELEAQLQGELVGQFPLWQKSLAYALEQYEAWLQRSLAEKLTRYSSLEREEIIAPLEKVRRQVYRLLQGFRDQLSERSEKAFGVALRTSETEIQVKEPQTPDVRIGRVFDTNWELLSWALPMWLVGPILRRHFHSTVSGKVEINLSRIAAQWEESSNSALLEIGKEAERRINELVETVERLLASSRDAAPQIITDREQIRTFANKISEVVSGSLVP
jgi:GTP-binding protein EngB required for normal cell division